MTTDVQGAQQDAQSATSLQSTISGNGWVADGLSPTGGMASLDSTIRPIDALHSAGLDWLTSYVQPLQDVIDHMAGKSAAIQTFSDSWQQAATALGQVYQQLGQSVTSGTAQWQGSAGDAYRSRATEITTSLQGAAALAGATASVASTMGAATASARQQVGDLVTQLVQQLISYVNQAKAAEGGVTPNVMSQATSLINSYQAPVAGVQEGLTQTITKAKQQLDGTVQVASLTGGGGGAAILSTWNAIQQRLDDRPKPVGDIIQIPGMPLPPNARPATKAELNVIAANKIFVGKLGYKVTIGDYVEAAALKALGLTKNTQKFFPYDPVTDPGRSFQHVIPDAAFDRTTTIISSQGVETHTVPDGTMVDVKATSDPISRQDSQFIKYVDYLSKDYDTAAARDPEVPKPALIYVATSETQISDEALAYASRNNVEVYRAQIFLSGPPTDPLISVGPAQSLIGNNEPLYLTGANPQQAVPLFNTPVDEILRNQRLKDDQ